MKIDLIPLPQEKTNTCLPAAIRIVLHHFGADFPEEQIAQACKTRKRGTNLEHAADGIKTLGFKAIHFEQSDLPQIIDYLNKNIPVIVALDVEQLPYGDFGFHAVVVNELEGNIVSFVDPALGKETSLDLLTFFKSWHSLGRSGLVIYPKANS
jgi:ABC-type bacteriocin/lantibiotic exporter with double-glycine peptidase domain